MGFLSKVVKSVVRATKAVVTGGGSEAQLAAKKKESAAKSAAAGQLASQTAAAEAQLATEQASGTKRKQQLRSASLLGSYNPDDSTGTLLG